MATTGTIWLNEPVTIPSSQRTAFFNGRLLSAEDLQREQSLREMGQNQLARLIGCGVQQGLEVVGQQNKSVVTIGPGLGVSPSGQVMDFGGVNVDLAAAAQASSKQIGFRNCGAAFSDLRAPTAGLYLLVLTPAWISVGRAPSMLSEVGACSRNVEHLAARVRLVALTPPANATNVSLRNQLAVSLLAPTAGSAKGMLGWLPVAVAPKLGADDLPLAALQLDAQANIVFLDQHAARRRLAPVPGGTADALWPRSRSIEMEAFAQQCLQQWEEVRGDDGGGAIQAFSTFPPVLMLRSGASEAASTAFDELAHLLGAVNKRPLTRGELATELNQCLSEEPVKGSGTAELFTDGSSTLLRVRALQVS